MTASRRHGSLEKERNYYLGKKIQCEDTQNTCLHSRSRRQQRHTPVESSCHTNSTQNPQVPGSTLTTKFHLDSEFHNETGFRADWHSFCSCDKTIQVNISGVSITLLQLFHSLGKVLEVIALFSFSGRSLGYRICFIFFHTTSGQLVPTALSLSNIYFPRTPLPLLNNLV